MQLTTTVAAGVNNWPAGNYYVGYTYLSTQGERVYETAMSPTRLITLGANTESMSFGSIFASDDPQIDRIQVYVTATGGTVLFKAQTFANANYTALAPAVVNVASTTLTIPYETDHEEPLNFRFMVERDGRMIWSGSNDAPNAVYWSSVDFPEYVGPLNFVAHIEEVTGLAVGANNELIIFGRTARTVIFGDITDLFSPRRTYRDGGCIAHNSIRMIGGFVYGVGVDGPFRCDAHRYQPVDEINFNGQVIGSIRDWLEVITKKEFWHRCWSAYDIDKKTWYLTVPGLTWNLNDSGAASTSQVVRDAVCFTLQIDVMAWARDDNFYGGGFLMERRTGGADTFKVYGSAMAGFLCDYDASELVDGLLTTDPNSFLKVTHSLVDNSITLNGTPVATGEGVKGMIIRGMKNGYPTGVTARVLYQNGAKIYVTTGMASFEDGHPITFGVYQSWYVTKGLDARTTVASRKLWRHFDVHNMDVSGGILYVQFQKMSAFSYAGFSPLIQMPIPDGAIGMTHGDGRIGIGLSTEYLRVLMGTANAHAWQLRGYSLEYEQMGVN